jgi:hypothetical protein
MKSLPEIAAADCRVKVSGSHRKRNIKIVLQFKNRSKNINNKKKYFLQFENCFICCCC